MSEYSRGSADFVGYEYTELLVPVQFASLCLDSYPCFGWEIDPNDSYKQEQVKRHGAKRKLYFRRNPRICNRPELTRLQRNFDGCLVDLGAFERRKTSAAKAWAWGIGILGTVFMAISTFAVTAPEPSLVLCVLFAIPGFAGWIAPYFVYKCKVQKNTPKIVLLVEEKYEEIYDLCEKGIRLQK